MMSLYVYYALCFEHVEHCVCHEPISVLINIYAPSLMLVELSVYIYICIYIYIYIYICVCVRACVCVCVRVYITNTNIANTFEYKKYN